MQFQVKLHRQPRSRRRESSAASDVDKRQDQSGTRVRALELLIKVLGGFAPEKQEVTSYHGSFLADLDLDEADLDELLVETSKEIKDLH